MRVCSSYFQNQNGTFLQQLECGYGFPALIHVWIASAGGVRMVFKHKWRRGEELLQENHSLMFWQFGKYHTSACALKLSCYIFPILHWFNEFFFDTFLLQFSKFCTIFEKTKKTCQMLVLQFRKKHNRTSALKLSLSYIDLTIFSRNFAQKFQIFVLNSNFL